MEKKIGDLKLNVNGNVCKITTRAGEVITYTGREQIAAAYEIAYAYGQSNIQKALGIAVEYMNEQTRGAI